MKTDSKNCIKIFVFVVSGVRKIKGCRPEQQRRNFTGAQSIETLNSPF